MCVPLHLHQQLPETWTVQVQAKESMFQWVRSGLFCQSWRQIIFPCAVCVRLHGNKSAGCRRAWARKLGGKLVPDVEQPVGTNVREDSYAKSARTIDMIEEEAVGSAEDQTCKGLRSAVHRLRGSQYPEPCVALRLSRPFVFEFFW